MSHLHFTLLRESRGWSCTNLPWASTLVPHRGVVEDESPPLHPIEKRREEKRMVMDQLAMADLPFFIEKEKGLKDESSPLHPTEKEKNLVMDQVAMAKSPCSLSGSGG